MPQHENRNYGFFAETINVSPMATGHERIWRKISLFSCRCIESFSCRNANKVKNAINGYRNIYGHAANFARFMVITFILTAKTTFCERGQS